ncbi:MAG: hypothetical protein WBQ14_05950 [Gaiellaceae bacterium]
MTKKSFTKAQAGSVKLVYKFSATSKSFGYLLSFKKGSKWQTVKSVKKKGTFKGSKSMTAKKLFAGKAIKAGSHRLKLSADGGSKTLSFKVVTAAAPAPVAPVIKTGNKPANTVLPIILGATTQGLALYASNGSWSNSPTSYSYQWRRCTSSGASCVNISGATSTSYALVYADAGSTIRVVVTATNAYGSTGATSNQTAVVVGLAPANTAFPTISGTAIQGRTLTASNGSWSNSPTSYSYQWRRCGYSDASCVNISGATSSSYTLVYADLDLEIRVVVAATNSYGSVSATSARTAWVEGPPPVNLTLPTISGTLAQGQTLTASAGTWSDSDYYYYEWYRCDPSGANCVYISGAYGSSYRLTSSDVGKTIHVVVEADNDYGYAIATSSQTGVVGAPPANTSLPTVSGSIIQGQALAASNGSWSNSATSWAYQWLRCDSYGTNCTDIASETSSSYALVSGDVGKTIRVVVTATNSSGSASATSERTGLVNATAGTSAPVNTSLPTVSGSVTQGQTLTASDGTWSNSPTSYTYQWRRCDSSGANCTDIASATSSSYALVSGDVGRTIRIVVTATNSYGSPSATSAQTAVVTGPSTTSVSAGYEHTCALISTGAVKCWGDNSDGQLGNGSMDDSSAPVSVSGISTATQISAGRYHTCALLSGGTVKCWGWNGYGQLGDGSTDESSTPVSVSGISTAIQISGGGYHTCALLSGGTVKCWGANWYGALGDGSTDDSSTPVSVSGISTATQISAGRYHSCALLSDGTVECWGENMDGQLGNGTEDDSTTPIQVKGVGGGTSTLSNVTQISAGYDHSCALLLSGAVDCWGFGGYGQLGNGAYVVSTTPVQVKGVGGTGTLSNVTQISAGGDHSCALLSGGTANCWGDNEYGQVGDGSLNNRWTPVQVKGVGGTGTLSNVTQITAGGSHSCVLLSGGTVNCWGDNVYGQLGDGSTDDKWTPVSVTGLP